MDEATYAALRGLEQEGYEATTARWERERAERQERCGTETGHQVCFEKDRFPYCWLCGKEPLEVPS